MSTYTYVFIEMAKPLPKLHYRNMTYYQDENIGLEPEKLAISPIFMPITTYDLRNDLTKLKIDFTKKVNLKSLSKPVHHFYRQLANDVTGDPNSTNLSHISINIYQFMHTFDQIRQDPKLRAAISNKFDLLYRLYLQLRYGYPYETITDSKDQSRLVIISDSE